MRAVWLCIALAATVVVQTTTLAQQAEILTPENAIPDQYIVVLDDDAPGRSGLSRAALAQALAGARGGRVTRVYQRVLTGFVAVMPAQAARALARDSRVRFIEQDSVRYAIDTQMNATWGLDRIDQRDLPLSTTYTYNTTGSGVHGYIIDTGIRSAHDEFTGRVAGGFTSINDGRGTDDCNGHGTHVAGTVGGATYGVAKQVTLHPVRVLNCSGSGSTSGVIAGVDWVTQNQLSPSVANMSLGGGASTALDTAVANSIASGVTYSIAAGNSNANACNSSPARVGSALTVGASTNTDSRASFSNFGTCVDLFAPGANITSAWNTSNSATNTISGTSVAAPHVAGAVALYLEANPAAAPAAVNAAIVANATVGRLTSVGTGSPNRLLYSLFDDVPPGDNPPVAAFTFLCNELDCDFTSTSTDDVGISSYSWTFGDGGIDSGPAPSHHYGSSGTYTVTLTVTDTIGQTSSTSKPVTVSSGGGAPCTNCTAYPGSLSGTGDWDYHPNGSYYYSPAGTHRGWLVGPANADFDLFLERWYGFFGWLPVAASYGATSVEQITYAGSAGYYRWRVDSYSGSGNYTFWLQKP